MRIVRRLYGERSGIRPRPGRRREERKRTQRGRRAPARRRALFVAAAAAAAAAVSPSSMHLIAKGGEPFLARRLSVSTASPRRTTGAELCAEVLRGALS